MNKTASIQTILRDRVPVTAGVVVSAIMGATPVIAVAPTPTSQMPTVSAPLSFESLRQSQRTGEKAE